MTPRAFDRLRSLGPPAKTWRARALVLVFMAGYLSLAQPGICPCWLLKDVREIHPHPTGRPEHPHSHAYLFEMFASAPAAVPNLPSDPPSVFLDLLSQRGAWRGLAEIQLHESAADLPPPTPPPETASI